MPKDNLLKKRTDATPKTPTTDKDMQLFSDLYRMVEDAQSNSSTWRDNTDTYYRLRMRYKKTKNFPFPGCSNLRLPTIETYIRKAKAAYMATYHSIKPRMMVIPQSDTNLEKARRIEKFLDWLADSKIHLLEKLTIIVDKMLERGFCLAKIVWKMESVSYTEPISLDDLSVEEAMMLFDLNVPDEQLVQFAIKKFNIDVSETVMADNIESITKAIQELRSGKEKVNVKLRDELYNAPDVMIVDPLYAGVPTDGGRNPQDNRMVYHEYFENYDVLKQQAEDGILDKLAIDNIDFIRTSNLSDFKLLTNTQDTKEGIERINNPSQMVRLIDLYTYYDLDDNGSIQKCHFLLAPDFSQVLKKQRLENDSQQWPFVRFDSEIIDDRWYSSRGIPQHLEDMSKEIDAQHNQKLDNQTIRNAPMFAFRSGIVNPKLVKFIPGQGIPIPGMTPLNDAIQILNNQNTNVEYSYEREELMLKSTIQEYLGQMDYSVQSIINKRQPRTLGEVQMQAQAANTVFSLDVALFTSALSQVYTQLLEFCQQYMPERIFALISGENGIEPLHLTRDEIQGKYNIICRANDTTGNPILRMQNSMARTQMLMSEIPMQTGIVTPMNVYNVLKRYLQDSQELGWKELISEPQPAPSPLPPNVAPQFDSLTDQEQAQILQRLGIQPDVQGRALKSSAIVQEKASEQQSQRVEDLSKVMDMIGSPGDKVEEEE